MGRRMGPVDLMYVKHNDGDAGSLLRSLEPAERDDQPYYYHASDMSTEQARCVADWAPRAAAHWTSITRAYVRCSVRKQRSFCRHHDRRGRSDVGAAALRSSQKLKPRCTPPTNTHRVAMAEVVELLEGAEAKAYYGLAINWKPLGALTQALLERGVLSGREVAHILEVGGAGQGLALLWVFLLGWASRCRNSCGGVGSSNLVVHVPLLCAALHAKTTSTAACKPGLNTPCWPVFVPQSNGVIHFPDPYTRGFGWDAAGNLSYPFKAPSDTPRPADGDAAAVSQKAVLSGVAAKTWGAGTDADAPRDTDGKFAGGWHWNQPYSVQRDLPDWFRKELDRYSY